MSIPSTPEVGRVSNSTRDRTAAAMVATPSRRGSASPETPPDEGMNATPTPPRFPWLSRLSQQLESVAKQKPAFPSAPVLGDHVDKSA